jgi:hypothetical protein
VPAFDRTPKGATVLGSTTPVKITSGTAGGPFEIEVGSTPVDPIATVIKVAL